MKSTAGGEILLVEVRLYKPYEQYIARQRNEIGFELEI